MPDTPTFDSLERVAGSVSRETFNELVDLLAFFHKWASRINLVSRSTYDEAWTRHILDSAQLLPHSRGALRWADMGSGGGFPGLVLGTLMKGQAGGHVDLIESNNKKASFLKSAIGSLGLPATVHTARIEQAISDLPTPEIVTARALAPLGMLLDYAAQPLLSGARALFHKGQTYKDELKEVAGLWEFDLEVHASAVENGSVILDISNLRRR